MQDRPPFTTVLAAVAVMQGLNLIVKSAPITGTGWAWAGDGRCGNSEMNERRVH